MTNWIISSSILILAIICLRSLFTGKISLRLQYALWLLVAVRLIVPVNFGSSAISIENFINRITVSEHNKTVAEHTSEKNTITYNYDRLNNSVKIYEGVETQEQFNEKNDSVEIPLNNPSHNEKTFNLINELPNFLFYTWLAGIVVLGGVFIVSNIHFTRKLKRTKTKIDVSYTNLPVYVSKVLETPCLFGFLHPCIYVTETVAKDSVVLRHSVYHEMSHYRQGDLFWAILRCVCLTLHWYNPFVWWAAKLSRQDAELACDEATLFLLGEEERLAYGKTLIQLTCEKRQDLFVTATTMTSDKKGITERIKLIAKKPKLTVYALVIILITTLVTVGCTFTNASKVTADDTEISQNLEPEQNNQEIEKENSFSENGESIQKPEFFNEAQKDKVCLAVMPDGISKAGGDYRYIIPEDQVVWTEQYKQARSLAVDGGWKDQERSSGIWIVFNDEWTCITNQGMIFDFSKRVEKSEVESFYELCMDEAIQYGTGTPIDPEYFPEIISATLEYQGTYTVTDSAVLSDLRKIIFTSEELRGGAACPFTASLTLELKDQKTEVIYLATDSCTVWLTDGVYYEYYGYEDIEEIYEIFLENDTNSANFLSDPLPGIPCANPQKDGWDLLNVKDVRKDWNTMSYIPKEGTENNTYLLGKTEHFTLYGKGDFETMLLECDGKYAEIRHNYASNYMTPLELMEKDFDEDGRMELSIKFCIKHGTGVYIDTFLMADFGSDDQLYVHQFLDDDFTNQLAAHLSYQKTDNGIQAMVDGKPAGTFMENLYEMELGPFYATSLGAQMRFYYDEKENEVLLSGDIMFLIDGHPEGLWFNGNDVTATVQWDGAHFSLSNITSRNRTLDEQVYFSLLELYDVAELYYVNVRYDSSKMNADSLVITAEILPQKTDFSYDYAEIHLKRAHINSVSGWEIEEIYLEK